MSAFAPRIAHVRSALQEFARRPHSRSVSEKFTADVELISACICFTQLAKSCGKNDGGSGRLSHDVRSAHICSMSSMTGGVTVVVSGVVDDETQQKIDVVKQRLIKYFGYNETSATDVLNYVASIFARGDSKQDE